MNRDRFDRLDAALHKHEGYPPGTTTRQIAAGGNDERALDDFTRELERAAETDWQDGDGEDEKNA